MGNSAPGVQGALNAISRVARRIQNGHGDAAVTKRWGLVAIGLGVLQIVISVYAGDAGFNAPRWLLALIGVTFSLAGIILLVPRRFSKSHAFLIAVLTTAFAVVPNWIAFGPGPRRFSTSLSFGPAVHESFSSDASGRIAFGLSAIVMNMIAVWGWVQWARLHLRQQRSRAAKAGGGSTAGTSRASRRGAGA